MRHTAQVALVGIGVCLVATHPPQAAAATYTYPASCTGSYSKQGNENADLTKLGGSKSTATQSFYLFPKMATSLYR